ncbi:hypothetical protein CFE70_004711 [Pyrenophora teres f. teres 0-1]
MAVEVNDSLITNTGIDAILINQRLLIQMQDPVIFIDMHIDTEPLKVAGLVLGFRRTIFQGHCMYPDMLLKHAMKVVGIRCLRQYME